MDAEFGHESITLLFSQPNQHWIRTTGKFSMYRLQTKQHWTHSSLIDAIKNEIKKKHNKSYEDGLNFSLFYGEENR